MILTQEIKEQYKMNVYQIIEQHRNEKIKTQFEISIDTLDDFYGWDYEDELGEIFDEILEQKTTNN